MDTIINLNAIQFTKQSMKLSMKLFTKRQSHYIEVAQAAIFMEQNMRFWADFGPVGNTEKNFGTDNEQLLRTRLVSVVEFHDPTLSHDSA